MKASGWNDMMEYMQSDVKYKNKEELISRIKAFWMTVTPAVSAKYTSHFIPQVLYFYVATWPIFHLPVYWNHMSIATAAP